MASERGGEDLLGLNPQPVESDAPAWWAVQVDSVRIELVYNSLLEVLKKKQQSKMESPLLSHIPKSKFNSLQCQLLPNESGIT